jgi:phosphatidate cytidylyltransferase
LNDKNRNLVVRIISALILLPVSLIALWFSGPWSGGLLAFGAAACTYEYYHIVYKRVYPACWLGIAASAALPLLPALYQPQVGEFSFGVVAFAFFFGWIYFLLVGPVSEAPTLAAHFISGSLFGGIGMGALSGVRVTYGFGWVLCALVITWMNDTCAYFVGRFLGKHKLYPAVSPNKTWEGFFGGMGGSLIGLFIVRIWFKEVTVVDCIVLGVLAGVTGPLGDLGESMLKRAYQVKDSGKIIPGHGGMLDRLDALLLNAAVTYLYATFIRSLW